MGVIDTMLWVYGPLLQLQTYILSPSDAGLPLCWVINLSKGSMGIYIFSLMLYFDNYSLGCWLYLAMHGSYGVLWLTKDLAFGDKTFRVPVGPIGLLGTAAILGAYHVLPYLMVSGLGDQSPSPQKVCVCVALYVIGIFWMCASDAQKNFTLKVKPGLVRDGMFARTRNPNYFGEVLLYGAFGLLVSHRLAFWLLGTVWCSIFVSLMLQKEKSLRRKAGWAEYARQSWFFLPKPVASSDVLSCGLYVLALTVVLRLT